MEHSRGWLLGIGIVTAFFAVGVVRLEFRTDGRALHPAEHPQIQASAQDRAHFLEPEQIVLLVHAPDGADLLASPLGFRFLERLNREVRGLSAIRASGVVSIASLLRVTPDSVGLSLGSYLDSVPEDPIAFAALLAEIRALSLTEGLLLSSDGRLAAFYLPLSFGRPLPELIGEMQDWLAAYPAAPFDLWLTGPAVAETTLGEMVLRDLLVLVPIMVVTIMLLLYFSLKSLGGVVIPLAEAVIVLIWVFGAMGWTGVPVTLVTTILPVVLMAIAITDELHLLERVQVYVRVDSPRVATEKALKDVGRPILVTSVTTALGFLSFLGASVIPLQQFGIFMSFGILLALVLSFSWIPALIVSLPRSWLSRHVVSDGSLTQVEPPVSGVRNAIANRPGIAFAAGVVAVAIGLPGISRLQVQDAWLDNFAPDAPLVTAERLFNDAFWGSYRFDLVIEGDRDFFYSPAGAELVEQVVELASGAPHVGGVMSYLDPLGDVALALGEDGPLSKVSPLRLADIAVVAEMGENRLGLRQLVTDAGESTRVRLFANQSTYVRAQRVWDHLEARLPQLMRNYSATYHYSGELPDALAVVDAIVWNQLRSIGWALLTVVASLVLLFRLGRGALVAMVPVLSALVMVFGGMGYAGIPLGIATSMFGALTVGIGVDFGVHFLHRYQNERRRGLTPRAATGAVMGTTGRVLNWNATVLALGFLVLTFSNLAPNFNLGLLLSAAILLCYASALCFLPRLLPLVAGVLAILLLPLALPSAALAAVACPQYETGEDDSSANTAEELMAAIESDFRRGARIVRMGIRTSYRDQRKFFAIEPSQKTLWGVFDNDAGDHARTNLLYVFSGPGRLAGTTLLMHDYVDLEREDSMWLYLRSFDIFKKIEPNTQQVLVPGTALSYEDSRGFIPRDKFRFSISEPSAQREPSAQSTDPASVWILACPRSESIAKNLGYSSLLLQVDPDERIVLQVEYADLSGRPLKRYRLVERTTLGDRSFPAEVQLRHFSEGFLTNISYEYWLPKQPPPASLFAESIETGKFIQRLKQYVTEAGLGDRIETELIRADEQLREFVDRLSRMKGGKEAASGIMLWDKEARPHEEP